jgi:hypothetical protein
MLDVTLAIDQHGDDAAQLLREEGELGGEVLGDGAIGLEPALEQLLQRLDLA